MLSPDHLSRRLASARELRGFTQAEFNDACAELGLGRTEASRVERGTLDWRAKHTLVFAQVLRVPQRWFTEESDDVVVGLKPPQIMPSETREILEQLLAALDQVGGPAETETTTRPAGADRRRAGPGDGAA